MSKKHKTLLDLSIAQLQADAKYMRKSPLKVDKCEVDYDDHTPQDYETVELMRYARSDARDILEHAASTVVKRATDPKRPLRSMYNMADEDQAHAYHKARNAYVLHEGLHHLCERLKGIDYRGTDGTLTILDAPWKICGDAYSKAREVLEQAAKEIEPHIVLPTNTD